MKHGLFLQSVEWLFFGYFILIYLVYAILNVFAVIRIRRYLQVAELTAADNVFSSLDLPVSVIVPAYNEAESIITSTRAMLQVEYPDFEVIVVNDGSRDDTLQKLIDEFSLQPFPEAYRQRVPCKRVRGIFRSALYPSLRVVDKENGGSKADAMNAGINTCRCPIFCAVDADSILQPDSLRRAVRPFLEEPNTVATGGTVRIANGCQVRGGFLEKVGLPSNFLALVQVVEYLRAFLYGRMGWTQMNAVLIISGAFGVFDKEAVVRVGGYDSNAIGEDMELVLRLHRYFCESGEDYKITFVPDPICWTDGPEDLDTLGKQRIRWQHGLGQSLRLHKDLLFGRKTGAVGWLAVPFFYIFELFGPVVEIAGYVFMTIAGLNGWVHWETAALFFCLAVGLGVMLSMSALVLEEMSFHVYPRVRDLFKLFAVAILENFGYRQLTLIWRIRGLVGWMRGQEPEWGEMKRSASLSEP
jgi:cellulose synthase/poly-beta-1,6-N-acetylglucosamine synthase-like glycosyltransferase